MTISQGINSHNINRLFWALFSLTILTIVGIQLTGVALITDIAPEGIVSFELVGTLTGSQNIIDSWEGPALTWAGINMGLDFLFLFLYAVTIALACLILSEKMPIRLRGVRKLGRWLAIGIMVAATLDIIENISLIALLTGSESEFLPVLARYCAIPKFGLVLISLLYVITGGLVVLTNKKSLSSKTI